MLVNYLRNCWYQAAWSDEITPAVAFARQILGTRLVFFRNEAGQVAALEDRCSHRFAPLSDGVVAGGTIACPYHGLRFGGDGACVFNPHGAALASLQVRSFPTLERHKAVWVWMGEPALADPALVPELAFIDQALATAEIHGHTHVRANYELLVDNIMDLSHADYLHASSLGSGFNTRVKPTLEGSGGHLTIAWRSDSEEPPPAFRMSNPAKLWTVVDWHAPALMVLQAGGHPVGVPDAGIDTLNLHNMTPESATSTHYFTCNTRNFRMEDAAFNEVLRGQLTHAFQVEDKPMVEKVQAAMGTHDLDSLAPIMLAIDAGPVRARRRLRALIAAENGVAPSVG